MRVHTTSSVNLPIRIWTENELMDHISTQQIIMGLFYGIITILLTLSLNGIGFQYLWPDTLWLCDAAPVLIALTEVGGSLFTRSFLNLHRTAPFWDRVMIFFMCLNLIMACTAYLIPH